MRCVILRPPYRPPRVRMPQGQLLSLRYVGPRTIFRSASGATLPAGLSPRLGTIFLGLIGLGFISTMLGVSVCLLIGSAITYLCRRQVRILLFLCNLARGSSRRFTSRCQGQTTREPCPQLQIANAVRSSCLFLQLLLIQ